MLVRSQNGSTAFFSGQLCPPQRPPWQITTDPMTLRLPPGQNEERGATTNPFLAGRDRFGGADDSHTHHHWPQEAQQRQQISTHTAPWPAVERSERRLKDRPAPYSRTQYNWRTVSRRIKKLVNFCSSRTNSRKRDSSQFRFPSAAPSNSPTSSLATSGNPNPASNCSSSSPLLIIPGVSGGGGNGPFTISSGFARKRMILSG